MIEGRIDASLQATIPLEAVVDDEKTLALTALIDTGFNGELTLPPGLISQLNLPLIGTRDADLGDGSTITTEVYLGALLWNDQPRPVMILRGADTPLAGMELMKSHRLTIEVQDGGTVRLEELP